MAQQPIAIADRKALPVFRTPKHGTNSFHIAATTICLGLRRPRDFNRVTSGSNLTFESRWDSRRIGRMRVSTSANHRCLSRTYSSLAGRRLPRSRRHVDKDLSAGQTHFLIHWRRDLSNSSTLAPPSVTAAVASMAGPVSRSMDAAVNFRPGSIAKRSSCVMFWLIRQTRNVPSGARTANALRLSCPAQAASEPARRARPAQA